MLVNALLWLFSILIALSLHALGLLLFDPVQPNPPSPNAFSEEIVVMLGEGAGGAIESMRPPPQPDSLTGLEAPAENVVDPAASGATEPDIEAPRVEDTISASLERDFVEPEAVEQSDAVDASLPPKMPHIQVAGVDVDAPSLSAKIPEAADTVAKVDQPVPVTAAAERSEVVATPQVVSPARLVGNIENADSSDILEVEASPATEIKESLVSQPKIDAEQAPFTTASEAADTPVPQPDTSDPEQTLSIEVEEEVAHNTPAAVVFEFETVDATPLSKSPDPNPESATLVSIEEQIARALTLDETQSSGLGIGVIARYAGLLKGRLEASMHYPRAARVAGQEGSVVVRFVIDRNGTVLSILLERASGHAILDREAVEMIERAEPFPAMPGEMAGDVLELRVPIAYRIDDASRTRHIPPINLE